MKIVSWNVNGLRAIAKKLPSSLGAFFRDLGADIVCLQETKISEKMLTDDLTQIPGYEAFFATCKMKQGYSGVCTYAREGITLDAKEGLGAVKEMDDEGRVMVTDHGSFVLLNIYFPNGGRGGDRLTFKSDFQNQVQEYCAELRRQNRHVIVLGDVNIAHTELDIYNPDDPDTAEHSGFKPEERKWFTDFLTSGFVDSFRERHPGEGGHYTWWSPRAGARADNRGWRLDYILVDDQFYRADVVDVGIMRLVGGSDHCPVHVTLKHQAPLPPHSPPLLSSKRRSKQAKLVSFFGGAGKPAGPAAKRPRLELEATELTGEARPSQVVVLDGDEEDEEEDVQGKEASRAGSVREEPERDTAEASVLLPADSETKATTPTPAGGDVFRSATQEAVEGATHLIVEAINSSSKNRTSGSSTSTHSPPIPPSSSSPPPPPTSEASNNNRAKAKATTSTKKRTNNRPKSTTPKAEQGKQQTSMLAFLGKRKDREADGS